MVNRCGPETPNSAVFLEYTGNEGALGEAVQEGFGCY